MLYLQTSGYIDVFDDRVVNERVGYKSKVNTTVCLRVCMST